jgi:Protein of unknown function (DUF3175)
MKNPASDACTLPPLAPDLREKECPVATGEQAMARRKKWSQSVTTVSTFPPETLFTQDAQTIARAMATKQVSPKGIGSGIRMVQFFINRAGKNLPAERKQELEKAKKILQEKLKQENASK